MPRDVRMTDASGNGVLDDNGNVKVSQNGSNIADGSSVNKFSFVLDDENYPVLRVVDAAPFYYNETLDAAKIQNIGGNTEDIFTLIDNEELLSDNLIYFGAGGNSIWGSSIKRDNGIDVSKYKKINLAVSNQLDLKVNIHIFYIDKFDNFHYATSYDSPLNVPAGEKEFFVPSKETSLNIESKAILLRIKTDTGSPATSGTISVNMEGIV
jgi:hypothetical protein